MPVSTGQVVNNRYQVISLLGQGGFGAVYKAWDLNMERPRALKENLDAAEGVLRQFKREAQILGDLSHQNLPHVLDHFIERDPESRKSSAFLVMDFVEGEDLRQMMEEAGGPLPEDQVLSWIGQVCDALEYLHSQDPPVIHRDIKPANIKITPQGRAMLVDFGIAKLYNAQTLTTTGARAVTSGFSPPEQYGRGTTDARSDVYALGATVYYLLTGILPPDSMDVVSGAAPGLPPAQEANPVVSSKTSEALVKAMQLNREQRWRNIAEFGDALLRHPPLPPKTTYAVTEAVQPIIVQKQGETTRIAPIQAGAEEAVERRFPASRTAAIGGIALAGLAGLSLLLWWLISTAGGRERPLASAPNLPVAAPTSTLAGEAPTEITAVPAATATMLAVLTQATSPTPSETPVTQTATAGLSETSTIGQLAILPVISVDGEGAAMAFIPAGEFLMGSENGDKDERPVHSVYLDGFYLDIYEATTALYERCVQNGACSEPELESSHSRKTYYGDPEYADFPVIYVDWEQASAFCAWRGGRLPSEAEWEKAARGGLEGMDYPWGNEPPMCREGAVNGAKFDDDASCNDTDTARVGSYSPNGYGLYDMAGNVWEWIYDWYSSNYYGESAFFRNPFGPNSGDRRVVMGGSWLLDMGQLRVADRDGLNPAARAVGGGFRCARSE